MTVYMGTTKIPAERTAQEIITELVHSGATSVNIEYVNGKITGLRWVLTIRGVGCLFEMPVRIEPLLKKINDREQAERTAWRQLLRWVQAQNALIQVGMAEAGEVYSAYWIDPTTNRSFFRALVESQFKALPAPTKGVQ